MRVAIYFLENYDEHGSVTEAHLREISKQKLSNSSPQVFFDVFSEVKYKREKLNDLQDHIRKNSFDALIINNLSDLADDEYSILGILQEITQHDVQIVLTNNHIDLSPNQLKNFIHHYDQFLQTRKEIHSRKIRQGQAIGSRGGRPCTRNNELITKLYRENKSLREIASIAKCSLSSVQAQVKLIKQAAKIQEIMRR